MPRTKAGPGQSTRRHVGFGFGGKPGRHALADFAKESALQIKSHNAVIRLTKRSATGADFRAAAVGEVADLAPSAGKSCAECAQPPTEVDDPGYRMASPGLWLLRSVKAAKARAVGSRSRGRRPRSARKRLFSSASCQQRLEAGALACSRVSALLPQLGAYSAVRSPSRFRTPIVTELPRAASTSA